MSNSGIIVHQPKGLAKILKDHTLKMPPHQREYSWKEKQIDRFYSDIHLAMNKESNKPADFSHKCADFFTRQCATDYKPLKVF